jgi:hypothetical protein
MVGTSPRQGVARSLRRSHRSCAGATGPVGNQAHGHAAWTDQGAVAAYENNVLITCATSSQAEADWEVGLDVLAIAATG